MTVQKDSDIYDELGKERLLNNLAGYDYKINSKEDQRLKVHEFFDNFLERLRKESSPQ